jgi:hypothetical protein
MIWTNDNVVKFMFFCPVVLWSSDLAKFQCCQNIAKIPGNFGQSHLLLSVQHKIVLLWI